MTEFLVISGMSGAGRSSAADVFDDMGWLVIDNLPASLIVTVGNLAAHSEKPSDKVALVVGRNLEEDIENVLSGIQGLKEVADSLRVIYLDASDDTLARRFEGTRRPHPIGAGSITEAISKERKLLTPLRGIADFVIDTGNLNVHQLRQRLQEMFSLDAKQGIEARVVSFGYAHGVPTDIDLLFDVRFLENPHWDVNLRPKTGQDQEVSDFVLNQSDAKAFIRDLDQLFGTVLPGFIREGKSYLTVAIGCTGGKHRSVAIANAVGELLQTRGLAARVVHRDLEK